MNDCNAKTTPGVPGELLSATDCPPLGRPCPSTHYSAYTGSLLWISRMTRPDLMQRATELAQFMHNPGLVHWQALRHLLAHLKGTKDEALVFKQNAHNDDFRFFGFVDANYAPDYGDKFRNHKSTTGWIFMINDVAFSWRSRKQPVLADSTSASEFLAAADASKHTVWLRRLFSDLGYLQTSPTILFEDNESCEKLVRNYCGHDRIKHLDIRASIVREHYARQMIDMLHTPDHDQLADTLTKVKPGPQTTRLRRWQLTGAVPDDCAIKDLLASSATFPLDRASPQARRA